MWNCRVTIIVYVMIRVSSGTFFKIYVPKIWVDFEDYDDDYWVWRDEDLPPPSDLYYQADMEEYNDTETYDYNELPEDNETTLWKNDNSDWGQYNQTDMEEFNSTETYDDNELWQDNDTDFWKSDNSDWGQYNQTDMEEFNQTEIVPNKAIDGQNITGAQTRVEPPPTPTTRQPLPPWQTRPPPPPTQPPSPPPQPTWPLPPPTRPPPPPTRPLPPPTQPPSPPPQPTWPLPPPTRPPPPPTRPLPPPIPPTTPPPPPRHDVSLIGSGSKNSFSVVYDSLLDKLTKLTGIGRQRHEDAENRCTTTNNEACVRKCCPKGQGFDMLKKKCRATPDEFNPYSLMKGFNASKEFQILEGKIDCLPSLHENKKLVTDISPHYHQQSDGTLLVETYQAAGPELVFNTTKYCIDWFITAENKTEWNAFICYRQKYDFGTHFVLNGSCMLIICILVLLRVVLFAWLPELRTLHGMILMAYLASFLVGFLLLGSKMLLMYKLNINREMCVVLTFIIYFFILTAFFWRNVMCYDMWWTFSGKRAMSGRGSTSRTRLYLYCTYAFGGPTAFTILLAALEYSDLPREHALMPKLRLHGCNSLYGYSKLLYFYGPLLILFVINMVLFTLTALKIAAIKKQTEMILQSRESETHDRKNYTQRFTLYVKLFAGMLFLELNWVIEIYAIFFPDKKNILQTTEVYNVVILIVILLNFLCQKQIRIMIKKRYNQMRGLPTSGQTTGVPTSGTLPSRISENQNDIQLTDYSREKTNPADSQDDTQSTDHSREKTNPAQSKDDTESNAYNPEKVNPAASQYDSQSIDYSPENANSAKSQDDAQSTDYRREKANPAASQDNTQSTDYSREEVNPAVNPDDPQSTDYSQKKTNPTQSQDDTLSTDYSREKANPAASQDDTESIDCSRLQSRNVEPCRTQGLIVIGL